MPALTTGFALEESCARSVLRVPCFVTRRYYARRGRAAVQLFADIPGNSRTRKNAEVQRMDRAMRDEADQCSGNEREKTE